MLTKLVKYREEKKRKKKLTDAIIAGATYATEENRKREEAKALREEARKKHLKDTMAAEPTVVEGGSYDEERAFYGVINYDVKGVTFDGSADGESAFKECYGVRVSDSRFALRYPFWHTRELHLNGVELTDTCRAALWYCEGCRIKDSKLHGIKALRECNHVSIEGCDIRSAEFGWRSDTIVVNGCEAEGEYMFFEVKNLMISDLHMKGKYSFQYAEDVFISDSVLDTKDAFWHAKRVHVQNSVVRGEYLGWYAEELTLSHCKIIGTQPFCYCKKLVLDHCEMIDCDLAFERSDVNATVTTPVISIKNPLTGKIILPEVGEIIRDIEDSECEIILSDVPYEEYAEPLI